MQLTKALGSCSSSDLQQKCCSLASVLAARRCHCRLGVPRQAKAQLEHVQHQCIRAHHAIVEQQIFNQSPAGADGEAPGSSVAVAVKPGRKVAPGSWADIAKASERGDTSVDGVAEAESVSGAEGLEASTEGDDGLQGEPTYSTFGSLGGSASSAAAGPVKLFVGVLTAGKNADRRAAIRASWGSDRRLHRCAAMPTNQPS